MKKFLVEFVANGITHRVVQGAVEIQALDEADAWLICEMMFKDEPVNCLNITERKDEILAGRKLTT